MEPAELRVVLIKRELVEPLRVAVVADHEHGERSELIDLRAVVLVELRVERARNRLIETGVDVRGEHVGLTGRPHYHESADARRQHPAGDLGPGRLADPERSAEDRPRSLIVALTSQLAVEDLTEL